MTARRLLQPTLDRARYEAARVILAEAFNPTAEEPYQAAWEIAAARGVIPESWIGHPRRFMVNSLLPERKVYPHRNNDFLRMCGDVEGVEAAERIVGVEAPVWQGYWASATTAPVPWKDSPSVVNEAYQRLLATYDVQSFNRTLQHGAHTIAWARYAETLEPLNPKYETTRQSAALWELGYVPYRIGDDDTIVGVGLYSGFDPVFRS